jgi:hypothetical protein
LENRRNRSTVRWTKSTAPVHKVHGTSLNTAVHPAIYDLDLNKTKSYFCSNLDRPSKIRWLGTILLPQLSPAEQSHRGAMAAGLRGPKLKLRCTICDEVSSYAIYTTRGTRFAHLWWRKWTRESGRWRRGLDDSWQRWLAHLMVLQWQEKDKQTPHIPLLLLHASISPGGDELNSHGKKSFAARVWCCGQNSMSTSRYL